MADMILAQEIALVTVNDSKHYDHAVAIMNNLTRKIKKGVYDPNKALVLWGYLADSAVQDYSVSQMGHFHPTLTIASPATRRALATLLANHYAEELATRAGVDHVLV